MLLYARLREAENYVKIKSSLSDLSQVLESLVYLLHIRSQVIVKLGHSPVARNLAKVDSSLSENGFLA